jgi:hypothetical protein
MKETKYRVYDQKGNFQQSYSDQLPAGFSYARDCAKRVGGYILKVDLDAGKEVNSEKVLDLNKQ